MTKIATFVSLILAFTLAATSISRACDCMTLSASESFESADTVFFGSVINVERTASSLNYTFKVGEILKGASANEIVITSRMTNCDFSFALNGVYIVYARKFESQLVVSACSATKGSTMC